MTTQSHNSIVIIDTRETKLIDLFKANNKPIAVTNLAIGDIILRHTLDLPSGISNDTENRKTRQITYEIIIERKCVQDMVASIKDGRYKEQKIRLQAEVSNTANPDRHVRIAYLIEGVPAELRAPADRIMLSGSVISSVFRDGIPILRTFNMQETYDLLVRFHDRMIKDYLDFFPQPLLQPTSTASLESAGISSIQDGGSSTANSSYLASVKKNKKDNMTPAMWNMNCLCGIPGVSTVIAIKIAEKYPTLRTLLDTYQSCLDITTKENLLAEIILTETDKQRRRIGSVVSKRVYEYFHI